jgi:serine/threonine-protein kinase HipA
MMPPDAMCLWWLGQPQRPILIGTLAIVRATRGVSLRYAPAWLSHGFALSEDLPLIDTEFLPAGMDSAAGDFVDTRPVQAK